MQLHMVPSLLFIGFLIFPALAHAHSLSGWLAGGGGIDDLSLTVQSADGNQAIIYCNGECGDWFYENEMMEGQGLKKALVGKRIDVQYTTEKNGGRIAGPGEDEALNFLKKAHWSAPELVDR